jgi:aminoglycoside/choline kinase family phosphotransferase
VPRTCEYIVQAARVYPEFAEFSAWLESVFLPALKQKQVV